MMQCHSKKYDQPSILGGWFFYCQKRGGYLTDKQILKDYVDACELVKETELDIAKLKKKRKTIIQTNVSGSNPEFPYNPMHFKVQ